MQYQLDLQGSLQNENEGSLVQKILRMSRQQQQSIKQSIDPSEHTGPCATAHVSGTQRGPGLMLTWELSP